MEGIFKRKRAQNMSLNTLENIIELARGEANNGLRNC
jgi:hypothetical protein